VDVNAVRPKALVLTGYGINCDRETAYACGLAGFASERIHLNDFLQRERMLSDCRLLVIPGGFSFGDDLGAGVAFASKMRFSTAGGGERLFDSILAYVSGGGLVLGVCNGFQILVRLGIIPAVGGAYGSRQVTLAPNGEGYFINRWVRLRAEPGSPNVFTRGMGGFDLPVRHGEGRFLPESGELLTRMEQSGHVALRYAHSDGTPADAFPENPNGSAGAVAGVCDSSGRIFGLMPHPEAAVSFHQHPDWTGRKQKALREGTGVPVQGDGLRIFTNAFDYVR
jgi:phosphoribosylformylglycinamidine synthase I